jgi:hypothetical protein
MWRSWTPTVLDDNGEAIIEAGIEIDIDEE